MVPLPKAVKSGAQPRLWGFEWASPPVARTAFAGRWLADGALAQLKSPVGHPPSWLRRLLGVALGLLLAFAGIPALFVALFFIAAAGWFWILSAFAAWLIGVTLIIVSPWNHSRRSVMYRCALQRWHTLQYCQRCGVIFSPTEQRVVPLDQLHDYLYTRP